MKKAFAFIVMAIMLVTTVVGLTACTIDDSIVVWVGEESATFYQTVADDYIAAYNTAHAEEPYPYKIVVKAVDSSTAPEAFLKDPDAGADILTIPHDNLGKLVGTSPVISPITSTSLLAQINADNSDSFVNAVTGKVDGQSYVFAVPYISQALVLFYDKSKLSENDVKTWEGIQAVAKSLSTGTKTVQAVSLMGDDAYNFSYVLLSRQMPGNTTTLRLYEEGGLNNTYCLGDDTVSVMKWAQRFYNDPNGGKFTSSAGFSGEFKDGTTLSLVGGAWKYNTAHQALGDNLAFTVLPTFTITSEDAYGSIAAGTVFQSGTFADCKAFVMKKNLTDPTRRQFVQDLMEHFSGKDIQEASFEQCNNLPAYKNASVEFEAMNADTREAKLAKAQTSMVEWSIPQPFGASPMFNLFYYQKGTDVLFKTMIENKAVAGVKPFNSDADIVAQLTKIQSIWKTGAAPTT